MEQETRIIKCSNLSSTVGNKMRSTLVDSSSILVEVGLGGSHEEIH